MVGGHIAHIIGVIEAFQRLGHEVVVGALSRIPYWENDRQEYRLFRTREFPLKPARGIVRQFQVTRQINRIITREKPAMLYVRWAPNVFFGMIRRQHPGIPIVVEANSTLQMPLYMRSVGMTERLLFRMTDRAYLKSATLISAVSNEVKEFIIDHHPDFDGPHVRRRAGEAALIGARCRPFGLRWQSEERASTPLLVGLVLSMRPPCESGVAVTLCHRSPNAHHPRLSECHST